MKWYRKAAEQGGVRAQHDLGVLYYEGAGVPRDYVKSHMWLSLAKAHGDGIAAGNLDFLQSQMTPAQIAEAQALATEWWEKIDN